MLADCISDMYKESGVCLEVETDKEHDSREAVCDTSARLAALTNINLNSQFPWSCCCYIKWCFFFQACGIKGTKKLQPPEKHTTATSDFNRIEREFFLWVIGLKLRTRCCKQVDFWGYWLGAGKCGGCVDDNSHLFVAPGWKQLAMRTTR